MGITGTALLVVALAAACVWLGISTYLGWMEAEAGMLHAEYRRCPECHRHYFGHGTAPHECKHH